MIAGWREREAKAGRIHTCGSQTVSGFPLRFEMRCADPGLELKSAAQPLSIKAKDILITAKVWQPTLLTTEITGPLTIADPGQPPTITANWQHAQSEVRGLPTAPEQVTMVFDQPVVERTSGGAAQRLFNAARLEIGGRMLEGSATNNPVIEVALKTKSAVAPTLHQVMEIPLDADITAVLRGLKDFRPKPWPDRFREIQAAGGSIEISNARLQQGETIAVTKGTLALSPSGRPHGQVAPHRRQSGERCCRRSVSTDAPRRSTSRSTTPPAGSTASRRVLAASRGRTRLRRSPRRSTSSASPPRSKASVPSPCRCASTTGW